MGNTRDNNNNNIIIAIASDCDGTLTLTEGSDVVFTPQYKSLFTPDGKTNYAPYWKIRDDAKSTLEGIFKTHEPWCITPDARDFIKNILQLEEISYGLISKNNRNYIGLLLENAEISTEDRKKIEIHSLHGKATDTKSFLNGEDPINSKNPKKPKNPNFIIIFEDSQEDEFEIRRAAQETCPNATIISFRRLSGKFEWKKRLEEIKQLQSGKTLEEIYPNLKDKSTLTSEEEIESPDNFITMVRPLGNGKSVTLTMVNIKPKEEIKDPLRYTDTTKPPEVVKTPLDPQLVHDFEKLALIRQLITHQGKKGFKLHHGWGITINDIKYSTSAGNILNYLSSVNFNAELKDLKDIYGKAREFIENQLIGKTEAQHRWYRFFLGDRDESTAKLYRDIFTILNCNLNDPIPNTIDFGTNEIHEDIRQKLAC